MGVIGVFGALSVRGDAWVSVSRWSLRSAWLWAACMLCMCWLAQIEPLATPILMCCPLCFTRHEPVYCLQTATTNKLLTRAHMQDSLSDWAAALLFDKAAEAARAVSKPKSGGGKKGGNASQAAAAAAEDEMDWQQEQDGGEVDGDSSSDSSTATAAMHELRPLLAAVCNVGSAAGACLGKLCAAMAVKRKLKAVAVARGLEALIAGE